MSKRSCAHTEDTTTAIPPPRSDAWGDLDDLSGGYREAQPIGYALMHEAINRVVEPTIARYENTVLNAWNAFCREHLPAAHYETAREYHRMMESMAVLHSLAVLDLCAAIGRGMRIGLDPLLTLEENFQRVCRAGGLDSPRAANDLMMHCLGEDDRRRFGELFPTVRLGIVEKEG